MAMTKEEIEQERVRFEKNRLRVLTFADELGRDEYGQYSNRDIRIAFGSWLAAKQDERNKLSEQSK